MDPRIDDVIKFWFDDTTPEQWFKKDAGFDATVRERYGALHADALAGNLDAWRSTARGSLALVVLLDQFPRNMFRDDRAFAGDPFALAIAKELLATGRAAELTIKQRMIAILPFMHSETLADQQAGLAHSEALAASAQGEDAKMVADALKFGTMHLQLIERFGRFPHRNAALGRDSTPDEVAYLATPGAGF
jgi:uncharacterized protein (DUF924 family)